MRHLRHKTSARLSLTSLSNVSLKSVELRGRAGGSIQSGISGLSSVEARELLSVWTAPDPGNHGDRGPRAKSSLKDDSRKHRLLFSCPV
ncbi:hypothetical protein F2P79_001881 [Pimephales promelas]|nr:hypothetical protein F2P79_001881 [Pimephales promelas]